MSIDVTYHVTLESPLIIRKKREGRVSEALQHIPGTTLRGALASAWGRDIGFNERFREIFLSGDNTFPFLYPGDWETAPYPLTAMSCKRQPGTVAEKKHGIQDALGLYLREVFGKHVKGDECKGDECKGNEYECRYHGCGADLKPLKSGFHKGIKEKVKAPTPQLRMGVGIEASTHTAANKILFGNAALSHIDSEGKQVTFGGRGRVADEQVLKELQDLCKYTLYMGAARSRGFGAITVKIEKHDPKKQVRLKERVKNFQHKVSKEWKLDGEGYFALTLRSPAILVDDYLQSARSFYQVLSETLQLKDDKKSLQHAQARWISGWNLAINLPKEDELALQEGSVFFAQSSLSKKDLLKALEDLEKEGIGIRRDEGFGQVSVCDPFHIS